MKYLLDTCVLSELVKKKPNRGVIAWLETIDEISLCLSVVSFGELQKGISKLPDSRRRRTLQSWVDEELTLRFAGRTLDIDRRVASRWGELSGNAERKGRKIPVLDGFLAATALEAGLTVVTESVEHFGQTECSVLNPWER
ncbi:MAG: type II toxin-antitoxin system VapC family toxin [Vicinamibacteria bacterium]